MRSKIMSDSEVNKIIAEFMGYKCEIKDGKLYVQIIDGGKFHYIENTHLEYTKSLDALIPVWEKLDAHPVYLDHNGYIDGCHAGFFKDGLGWGVSNTSVSKTIQQAAAHATAKAILELKGE